MTQFESYAPQLAATTRSPATTIFRDQPVPLFRNGRRVPRIIRRSLAVQGLPNEHVSDGILAGLAALTLPTMVYSFVQLWSLLAGGSLNHAVRAFLP